MVPTVVFGIKLFYVNEILEDSSKDRSLDSATWSVKNATDKTLFSFEISCDVLVCAELIKMDHAFERGASVYLKSDMAFFETVSSQDRSISGSAFHMSRRTTSAGAVAAVWASKLWL